jgi:lipopolysaccharide export system ATP-binding protein
MEHVLQVKSVTQNFGDRTILSQTGIECKTGEVIAVFGRNGTGKSTLFKILFGSLKPDHIEVHLDNQLCIKNAAFNKVIAYHPQEVMLPRGPKVKDLISIYIQDKRKQNKVFSSAGISDMLHLRVRNLSLGQQRYLQFLLVLNLDHHFVLLDEPFSMIEPLYKDLIKEKLIEYKLHKGFIITDHYYLDVLEVADKINVIIDQKIMPVSDTKDLISLGYLFDQSIVKQ